jgi:putative sensory transduction histidine kinase
MTFKEELGFDITRVLLDSHNEKLKTLRKEFMDLLEKAYGLVPEDKRLRMTELEDAFSDYVEAVKREYYNASLTVDIIVQNNIEKELRAKCQRA